MLVSFEKYFMICEMRWNIKLALGDASQSCVPDFESLAIDKPLC